MATSALREDRDPKWSLCQQKYFKQKHRCFRSIYKNPTVSSVPVKVTWLRAAKGVSTLLHQQASRPLLLGLLSVPGAGKILWINAVMPFLGAGLMENLFIYIFNELKSSLLLFQLNSARN